MRPHWRARMPGTTSRQRRTTLKKFSSKAASHCASEKASGCPGGGPPTLFTATSTRPQRSTVQATTRDTSSDRARSAGTARTCAARPARQVRGGALQRVGAARADRHARPLAQQRDGDGAAHAAARAAHDRHPPRQPEVHRRLRWAR